ncbi:MAG TPA: nucleotidyl transferase AbiEii/AbiGii toxin family protein, partial [bacterium]|nr:nucleotidyl transferase AbiEii/AbiGii toxin family protein [bacterium]
MPNAKLSEAWLLDMRKKIMLSFFSDDELMDIFVLKGGNALELIYKVTKRPSLDIDLSMEDDFVESDLRRIEKKIFKSLNDSFKDDNLEVVELKFEEKPAP